jgi:hypothetical protein
MSEIHEQQATPRGLLLQRAADGSHVVAHRIEMVRLIISLLFGVAAVVATVWPAAAAPIGVAGAAWALASFAGLGSWSQRETSAAALAQESFDTWLFNLQWSPSTTDKPLPDEELRRRARRSTLAEDRMTTWYPDVAGVEHEYGVLICQRENLTWDWRLRRRYANALTGAIAAWIIAGVAIGLTCNLTTRDLIVRWFVPSMSALLLAAQQARGNREIASEREQLAARVRAELEVADNGPLVADERARLRETMRAIQDGIYRTRKRSERVPRRLYEHFRYRDEEDMRETAADTVRRLRP